MTLSVHYESRELLPVLLCPVDEGAIGRLLQYKFQHCPPEAISLPDFPAAPLKLLLLKKYLHTMKDIQLLLREVKVKPFRYKLSTEFHYYLLHKIYDLKKDIGLKLDICEWEPLADGLFLLLLSQMANNIEKQMALQLEQICNIVMKNDTLADRSIALYQNMKIDIEKIIEDQLQKTKFKLEEISSNLQIISKKYNLLKNKQEQL